ncbi:MAG: hypothetical protein HXS48_13100 [Theionarchaea archaeon]|nr:hypothetical protein [Theionarchaea archaeon]
MDIPRGDAFLPEYTREDLIELYLKEKDSKAKMRLLAAIYRKEGLKYREISWRLKYASTTIKGWLRRRFINEYVFE